MNKYLTYLSKLQEDKKARADTVSREGGAKKSSSSLTGTSRAEKDSELTGGTHPVTSLKPQKDEAKSPRGPSDKGDSGSKDKTKKSETSDFWDNFFEEEGVVDAELPGKSELNISGRKFIKFDLKNTEYTNNPEKESQSSLDVKQQLQVKVRGSVADDLLEIQIDYDDSLPKVERQKTRVKYNGRKRDLGFATFQAEANFGDISLSLPGTRFVSYNKSVFGLSARMYFTDFQTGIINPEKVTFYGVASQEKGETHKKVFEGQKQRRIPEPLADIHPIRRTYYQLLGDTPPDARDPYLPIKVKSEEIYLDDQNEENNDANTLENMVVANKGDSYTGDFNLLVAGEDYTIDYRTGLIRFTRRIDNNSVIAAKARLKNNSLLGGDTPLLIKDSQESDTYDRYYRLNRYRLASRNIVRDDPDRVLHIRDENGNEIAPSGKSYARLLGLDSSSDDDKQIDDEYINFERGVLRFPDTKPFFTNNYFKPFLNENLPETNPTVYGPQASRTKKYIIYQELLVKENSYQLGLNVVRGSENVTVDGKKMERNRDYTIDYQTGFLIFFDRVEIDEDSQIEVTYETLGVGQSTSKTFLGGRMEATMSDNLSLGSTFMLDEQQETTKIPQLGQETKSTSVNELDFDWKPLHTFQDYLAIWTGYDQFKKHPFDKQIKFDVSGEFAQSTRNPNQAGKAVVDDFGSLEQRLGFSRSHLEWLPADAPQQFPGGDTRLNSRSRIEFEEVDGQGHNPDPVEEEDQQSLRVKMPMATGDTWSAFQYQFSRNGEDLRDYQYLKFWVHWADDPQGNSKSGTLSVDLGQLTEDVNRNGTLETEDQNNDQVLNPGEDIGFNVFDYLFGVNNSQLDGEDINRNGRLDRESGYLHFSAVNFSAAVQVDTTSHNWYLYKIPLKEGKLRGDANSLGRNISDTPTYSEVLKNAQTVRLVYTSSVADETQQFLLEDMGVIKTTWQTPGDTSKFQTRMTSSAEDPRLPPPNTNEYRSSDQRPRDKGLSVKLVEPVTAADSKLTRSWYQFPSGSEIKNYRKLSLYFYPDLNSSDTLTGFLRFGTGENNHFQYRFSYSEPAKNKWVNRAGGGWYRLDIDLSVFEQDMIDKLLADSDVLKRGNRVIRGDPSLLDVSWYELVLSGPESGPGVSGEIIYDYFTLQEVQKEEGTAKYVEGDLNLRQGLADLSFSQEKIEGEFRTIGLVNSSTADKFVVKDVDRRSVNGSLDVNRFIPDVLALNVPFNFSWSDALTEIPADRVERVRSNQLGKVDNESFSYNTGLNTPSWFPDFSFNFSEADEKVSRRRQDKKWETREEDWRFSSNYNFSKKFQKDILGFVPVGEGLSLSSSLSFKRSSQVKKVIEGDTWESGYDKQEQRRQANLNFTMNPYSWIKIKPNYKYNDLLREKEDVDGLITRSQKIKFQFEFSQFLGFDPSLDFNFSGNENFDRSDTPVSKNIKLTGNTNFRLDIKPEKWWTALDFLTMNYNYSLSGSGNYDDLELEQSVSEAYSDFFKDFTWLWKGPDLSLTNDTFTLARNNASKSRSHSVNGNLDFWSPLKTSYNFSYSSNSSQSENSVRESLAKSFSLDNRLALEKVSSWVKSITENTSLNFNYTLSTSEGERKESKRNNFSLGWSTRWNERWNTNFNLDASFGQSDDREVTTENKNYSPSLNFKWLVNKSAGGGVVWFDNKLQINGGVSANFREKTKSGEIRADNQKISANFGGSYNIYSNIKTSFGGNYSRYTDNYQEGNDRRTYGIYGSVDFRF